MFFMNRAVIVLLILWSFFFDMLNGNQIYHQKILRLCRNFTAHQDLVAVKLSSALENVFIGDFFGNIMSNGAAMAPHNQYFYFQCVCTKTNRLGYEKSTPVFINLDMASNFFLNNIAQPFAPNLLVFLSFGMQFHYKFQVGESGSFVSRTLLAETQIATSQLCSSRRLEFLYVTFHQGTRTNFDAMAFENNWNVLHIRPANGYNISREISQYSYDFAYRPLLVERKWNFDFIVVSDTIAGAGYSFLLNIDELSLHDITLVLHVTNYFDIYNEKQEDYLSDIKTLIKHQNVRVIYADQFIPLYMNYFQVVPMAGHGLQIPLAGRIIAHRYPHYDVPISPISKDFVDKPIYYENKIPISGQIHRVVATDRPVCPMGHQQYFYGLQQIDFLRHHDFGGPFVYQNYFAAVYFPYHYSTIGLQEFLSMGLIVFVQSVELTRQCTSYLDPIFMDVYRGPLTGLLEYYSSYEELQQKINDLSKKSMDELLRDKKERIEYMAIHDSKVYQLWEKFLGC